MRWSDLIRDEATGRASHTKVWANVGNAAMTLAFVRAAWRAEVSEGLAWLFLVFGVIVGGSQIASKVIGLRWGAKPQEGTS